MTDTTNEDVKAAQEGAQEPASDEPASTPSPTSDEPAKSPESSETAVDAMVDKIGAPIAEPLKFKGEGQAGNAMDTMHGKINDTRPRYE